MERRQREPVRDGVAIVGDRTCHRPGGDLVECRLTANSDYRGCWSAAIDHADGSGRAPGASGPESAARAATDTNADAGTDANSNSNSNANPAADTSVMYGERVSRSEVSDVSWRNRHGEGERRRDLLVDSDELRLVAHD